MSVLMIADSFLHFRESVRYHADYQGESVSFHFLIVFL